MPPNSSLDVIVTMWEHEESNSRLETGVFDGDDKLGEIRFTVKRGEGQDYSATFKTKNARKARDVSSSEVVAQKAWEFLIPNNDNLGSSEVNELEDEGFVGGLSFVLVIYVVDLQSLNYSI